MLDVHRDELTADTVVAAVARPVEDFSPPFPILLKNCDDPR